MRIISCYLLFLFVCFSIVSCENRSAAGITVDFSEVNQNTKINDDSIQKPLNLAIASMTSPKETSIYYKQLVQYLSSKLNRTIRIKQKKTYQEVNELLMSGDVDIAFICSGAYIELAKNNIVDILVAPMINEKTYYRAYIITNMDTSLSSFIDLKGRSFAFTDPLSNTGYTYPRKLLSELNTHERNFFSKTHYTYAHDISIHLVNNGVVDGASVHGLIFDYMKEKHPESVKNIRIIQKSEWFGMPPIVVPKSLDAKTALAYQKVFVDIHNDSLGSSILKKLKIERFVTLEDSIYNNVRKLKTYVETKNN